MVSAPELAKEMEISIFTARKWLTDLLERKEIVEELVDMYGTGGRFCTYYWFDGVLPQV